MQPIALGGDFPIECVAAAGDSIQHTGDTLAKRDSFLLRIDPRVLSAIRKWADDDMRSINAQVEYLLRQSLAKAGRLKETRRQSDTRGDE